MMMSGCFMLTQFIKNSLSSILPIFINGPFISVLELIQNILPSLFNGFDNNHLMTMLQIRIDVCITNWLQRFKRTGQINRIQSFSYSLSVEAFIR